MSKKKVNVVRGAGGVVDQILHEALSHALSVSAGEIVRDVIGLRICPTNDGERVCINRDSGNGTWLPDQILSAQFGLVWKGLKSLIYATREDSDGRKRVITIGHHDEWFGGYGINVVFIAEDKGKSPPTIYVVIYYRH